MSLYALHELTSKAIPSDNLERDSSWIGKQEDKWIMPDEEIENLIEIRKLGIIPYCSFIKSHIRNEEPVRCHFRIIDNRVRTYNFESESEEHKLAKDFIYYAVLDNLISFNIGGKVIFSKDLPSFKIFIEKNIGVKRADVLLIFDKEDEILGKGIVIEVQLSQQNSQRTNERSYDRALQGYSCVWLYEKHFAPLGLINPELKVRVFREILNDFTDKLNEEYQQRIAVYSLSVEQKIEELIKVKREIEEKQFLFNREHEEAVRHLGEIFNKQLIKDITPLKNSIKEELSAELDFYHREINSKAIQYSESAKRSIQVQEESINIIFNEAIDRIKKVSFDNLNNFNEKNNKKIEELLEKKVQEGIEFIKPVIKQEILSKLSEVKYQTLIETTLREILIQDTKEQFNKKFEESTNKIIDIHAEYRKEQFDKGIWSILNQHIDKKLKEDFSKANEELLLKVREKQKEMDAWIPELKKMAFEFLKNRVKEVTDEKRSEEDKSKVSL